MVQVPEDDVRIRFVDPEARAEVPELLDIDEAGAFPVATPEKLLQLWLRHPERRVAAPRTARR